LLHTSSALFKQLIPYLLLSATLMFTFGESLKKRFLSQKTSTASPSLVNLGLTQFAIAVYGGFFGAGMGILMLATLSFLGIKSLHSMNAL